MEHRKIAVGLEAGLTGLVILDDVVEDSSMQYSNH